MCRYKYNLTFLSTILKKNLPLVALSCFQLASLAQEVKRLDTSGVSDDDDDDDV